MGYRKNWRWQPFPYCPCWSRVGWGLLCPSWSQWWIPLFLWGSVVVCCTPRCLFLDLISEGKLSSCSHESNHSDVTLVLYDGVGLECSHRCSYRAYNGLTTQHCGEPVLSFRVEERRVTVCGGLERKFWSSNLLSMVSSATKNVFNKACLLCKTCLLEKQTDVGQRWERGWLWSAETIFSKHSVTTDVSVNGLSVAGFLGTRMMLDDLRQGLWEEKI